MHITILDPFISLQLIQFKKKDKIIKYLVKIQIYKQKFQRKEDKDNDKNYKPLSQPVFYKQNYQKEKSTIIYRGKNEIKMRYQSSVRANSKFIF